MTGDERLKNIKIPQHLKPKDGRFGSGPTRVPQEHVERLVDFLRAGAVIRRCEWGDVIWDTEEGKIPCTERASKVVRLSNPLLVANGPLHDVEVQLCPRHASRVIEETTAHVDG